MQNNWKKISVIATVLILFICFHSLAKNEPPVRIAFDNDSERTDIVTGRKLPNYTQAQRGSFQFYLGRLDTPLKGIWYLPTGHHSLAVAGWIFGARYRP